MKTVYLIMEINYEYNDEYYSKSDNDDGQPYKTVYTNKDEARAKLKELTVEWLKYDYLSSQFDSCYRDEHRYKEFLEALKDQGVITKKELETSLALYNTDDFEEPGRFITQLITKLTDARAFQLDILLNELENLGIVGYNLVKLELV